MARESGRGNGSDPVLVNQTYLDKPRSLLDAVKEIQNMAAMELETIEGINPMFFSLKDRLDMMIVGLKSSFLSGLIVALLTPLAIGVVERIIPIFGDSAPTLFDQIYALVLALGFTLGYGFFLATLKSCYIGNISKSMIRNLLGGVVIGAVAKALIAVIIFHFLYLYFTAARVASLVILFKRAMMTDGQLQSLYLRIIEFRPVLLMSSWFTVLSTLLFISIPTLTITVTAIKNRKREV
jgi:hypothetical protein